MRSFGGVQLEGDVGCRRCASDDGHSALLDRHTHAADPAFVAAVEADGDPQQARHPHDVPGRRLEAANSAWLGFGALLRW